MPKCIIIFFMSTRAPNAETAIVRLLNGDVSLETGSMLVGKTAVGLKPTEFARLYLASVSAHLEILRTLADEWIDSGINPDGTEQPHSRHLNEERCIEFREIKGEWTAVAEPKSRIRRAVNDYQEKYQIRLQLNPRGGREYVFTSSSDSDVMPEAQAILLFIRIYSSPWLKSLMRCAQCRTYDLVNSPRPGYINGWHCKKCRNSAPALRRTRKTRDDLKRLRLRYCAEEWLRKQARCSREKRAIATGANTRLRPDQWIKQNFVTRHLPEIMAQAAELRHHSAKVAEQ
jgi:hypothetical protein